MKGNKKIGKITKTFLGMAMVLVFAFSIAQISTVFAATTGPKNPTVGSTTGTTGKEWEHPGRIKNPGGSYTFVILNSGETSQYLKGSGFGFAIPAGATIDGLTVTMGRVSAGLWNGDEIRDAAVRISTDGTNFVGVNKAITGTNWPTSEGTATYGGAADTWGTTLTPAQVNSPNFSVFLSVKNANSDYYRAACVDYIRITVTYREVDYSITFDSAGGSLVSPISQRPETAVIAPADPTKAGYTFTDWSPLVPVTMPVGGAALTAQWDANEYTITFDSDGGSDVGSITQDFGTVVTAPSDPTKAGYTFAGWSPAVPATMPVGGASLTAQWTLNSYTITYNSNGGSAVGSITQNFGTAVAAPANPTRAGYTFAGWSPAVPATMPVGGASLTAQWTLNSYTITFDSNGGTSVGSITQNFGTAVTPPANPTRAGYTFAGWSPAVPATMPVGGASLTAQWTLNSYTISFDSNGGTSVGSITQNFGTVVTAPANPTRAGYTFAGWSPAVPATMPEGGAVLIAQWTVNSYTISFDSAGGTGVDSITQDFGTGITAPANPTKAGYTFAGWSPAVPANMPEGGAVLIAQWTVNSYTISFDSAGGNDVDSITQDFGTVVIAPADPTKAGYTFNGWSPAVPATMPVGGAALTAQWTVNSYTISFNSDGGTLVDSITHNFGTAVTAPTNPTRAGYTFAGWSPAVPATMPVGGETLKAQWTVNSYIISFDSDGGTLVDSITHNFGTAVIAPADPTKAGYIFAGWSPVVPATMPVGGAALTALWTVNGYTISFNSNGGSLVDSIMQDFGTAVKAPADPTKAGYTFAGWSPAVPATMPVGGAALTAQWEANEYTITFDSAGGTGVDSITQDFGTGITAPANPTKAGYTFAGWSPAVPATMPEGGAALTALWEANEYTITFDSAGGSSVNSITRDFGTDVTAPSNPTRAGYTFAGWSPALPATMPEGGAALTALWTIIPTAIPTVIPTVTPTAVPTAVPTAASDVLAANRAIVILAATTTPTTVPTAVPTTGVLGAAKTGEAENQNSMTVALILLAAFGVSGTVFVLRRKKIQD